MKDADMTGGNDHTKKCILTEKCNQFPMTIGGAANAQAIYLTECNDPTAGQGHTNLPLLSSGQPCGLRYGWGNAATNTNEAAQAPN